MENVGDILVVDDEANILSLVVEVLEEEGYAVRSATNGVDALEAIAVQRPGLVMVDMYMPHMSGMMVVEQLVASGLSDLPVILMTASTSAAEQALSQSNVDYLPKPFELTQLLDLVARYLPPPGAP